MRGPFRAAAVRETSPAAASHENASGATLRAPPSSWEEIKDLTPAGAKLLADSGIHLNTARRLVEEVRR